jgi:hypothetical protein
VNAGDAVWGGLILAGAAVETYALRSARQEGTLSAATRRWFRVHTKAGAICFAVAWTGFGVWYLAHILG